MFWRMLVNLLLYLQLKDSETIQTQQLLEKIDDYEAQLEDYKSELDKVNKVILLIIVGVKNIW